MRNLGKLLTALNPLDQSAMTQIAKATMGQSFGKRGLAFAKAGMKQIAGGGYFRGRTMNWGGVARGFRGLSGTRDMRVDTANARRAVAGVIGAWAGLNVMAPNSNFTSMANYGMAAAGMTAAGQGPIKGKWGQTGANIAYAGAAGTLGAKMFGVF